MSLSGRLWSPTGLVWLQHELCDSVWSGLWSVCRDDGPGSHGNLPHRLLLQPRKVSFTSAEYWSLLEITERSDYDEEAEAFTFPSDAGGVWQSYGTNYNYRLVEKN